MRRPIALIAAWLVASMLLIACGPAAAPTPTAVPPTAVPTATVVPPTATVAPTAVPTVAPATVKPGAGIAPTAAAKPAAPGAAAKPAAKPGDSPLAGAAGALNAFKLGQTAGGPAKPATSEIAKTAQQGFSQVKSFRMTGTVTATGEGEVAVALEYAAPDKLSLSLKLDEKIATKLEMPGLDTVGLIMIGDAGYLKLGPDWIKLDDMAGVPAGVPTPKPAAADLDFSASLVQALDEGGFKKVGEEAVNGEPCAVYGLTEGAATFKVFISTNDQFLRKIEGGDKDVQLVLTVTDLNKPVTIKAPL